MIDVIVVIVLLAGAVAGYRMGLVRSLLGLVGVIAGGIGAYFAIPPVVAWISEPEWRIAGVIGTAFVLVTIGYLLGATIGRVIGRGVDKAKLGFVDRLLGLVGSGIAAVLVVVTVASGVSTLGVAPLTQAVASSSILKTLDGLVPPQVTSLLAQLRTAAVTDGAPWVIDALGAPSTAPSIPTISTDNPALTAAAQSVVRITGTAYECGVTMSGSGFAVATDRVVTNAHVVAGISEPVVEVPGQSPRAGRIVYFDPAADLAVIAVDGLPADAIELSDTLAPSSTAVVAGYPFGGPFSIAGAEVLAAGPLQLITDGAAGTTRDAYTLAADIEPGNSGGPLLTVDGQVAGVVFAKASTVDNVGYALTMQELSPVAAQAPGLSAPVSTGDCAG
ncbi:MarP family serine protease [Agreia sp. PsM10]|uniref:MarP family serine protease n=1 Tax=Agreia sp. PsM10 TaxID=3030533 RepID=UPI00263B4209|nr:MarP family serine protease [Agreia sp. PsM10]MDN4641153.1 MarP family serine protease [Agreia sp. PsM10]